MPTDMYWLEILLFIFVDTFNPLFLNFLIFLFFFFLFKSSSVRSLSHVALFVTLLTAACQASLSFPISQSLLKLMSIESVMPSSHLVLCHPLFLLASIFPRMKVSSKESVLHMFIWISFNKIGLPWWLRR